MMLRHTVQFHWQNMAPTLTAARGSLPPGGAGFTLGRPGGETAFHDFDHFLASLQQEKRKKIRQERRKVAEAGVSFRWSRGVDISSNDWDFFYRCYERTYLEHGNAPYLNRDFFRRMAQTMPQHWLLFIAERGGQPIACSLIGIDDKAVNCEQRFVVDGLGHVQALPRVDPALTHRAGAQLREINLGRTRESQFKA